jgi:signal transduction histidine kinase
LHVEALAPVLDAGKVVVGIVRITDRLGNVYENFQHIRKLEIAAMLLSLLVAVGLGIWLARRFDLRLQAIIGSVEQVATANDPVAIQSYQPKRMPPEFARVFDAVSALSNRLRSSEDARKRLLANLVHEVGRPLGALQAAIHALQHGALEDPVLRQDILQGMDDQIERLKPLLDNLASLYVLSGQPVELQPEQVNLGDWLREILVTWQAVAQDSGLRWQSNLPDDLPVVSLDPNRMAQVIGNLIANAIQYTPEGGHILVAAGSDTRQVWISVEDTGIGITPEERQKIFEPLYRGPRARRFPQGMGLGLSIANDLVRLHGGDLQVSSEEGRGSLFTVVLPLEIHHLAKDPASESSTAP